MALKLYNTAARKLQELVPLHPGEVRMYHCGPTVYSSPHIGNFRSFLTADLLGRHLRMRGFTTTQIMNITDVGHLTQDDIEQGEDKMLEAAKREKLRPEEVARKYEAEFMEAARFLRFDMAHYRFPRATEHIPEMIEIIEGLLLKGYAYEVGGSVYFEQKRFPGYGALSGKKIAELQDGARIEVNPDKRDPRDFALWKVDEKHLMQWDTPWGRGFPGWHIECSAMGMKYLGEQFDLHTGGEDNLFPHHECEVAQSEAYTGKKPFVKYWLHVRHLLVDSEKMAKSAGNFFSIAELRAMGFSGPELRLALLSTHYRKQMNFTLQGLQDARASLQRIGECRSRLVRTREGSDPAGLDPVDPLLPEKREAFGQALDEDLNLSLALSVLHALVDELNRRRPTKEGARKALALFRDLDLWTGFLGEEPVHEVRDGVGLTGAFAGASLDALTALAREREEARKGRDFARADEIRDRIQAAGYRVVDTPTGPRLEPL